MARLADAAVVTVCAFTVESESVVVALFTPVIEKPVVSASNETVVSPSESLRTMAPFAPASTDVVPALKKFVMSESTESFAVTVMAAPVLLIRTMAESLLVPSPFRSSTLTAVTPCWAVLAFIALTRLLARSPSELPAAAASIEIPFITRAPAAILAEDAAEGSKETPTKPFP